MNIEEKECEQIEEAIMDPLRTAGGANMFGQAGSGQASESERMYNSIKNASKQEKEKRIRQF